MLFSFPIRCNSAKFGAKQHILPRKYQLRSCKYSKSIAFACGKPIASAVTYTYSYTHAYVHSNACTDAHPNPISNS
jgi:hypothetical protein